MMERKDNHVKLHNRQILWWALWNIIGAGSIVFSFYLGISIQINSFLKEWFSGYPFRLEHIIFSPSSLSLFAFSIGVTMFFTHALLSTRGFFHRAALLAAALFVLALTMPVCVLWGIYIPMYPVLLSLAVAGIGAVITAPFLNKPAKPRQ